VEDLSLDSGRTIVRTEYGYPKGSPNTNVKEEIRRYSSNTVLASA
jgi:membrane-bound lytic murein transglycosylase MltF